MDVHGSAVGYCSKYSGHVCLLPNFLGHTLKLCQYFIESVLYYISGYEKCSNLFRCLRNNFDVNWRCSTEVIMKGI